MSKENMPTQDSPTKRGREESEDAEEGGRKKLKQCVTEKPEEAMSSRLVKEIQGKDPKKQAIEDFRVTLTTLKPHLREVTARDLEPILKQALLSTAAGSAVVMSAAQQLTDIAETSSKEFSETLLSLAPLYERARDLCRFSALVNSTISNLISAKDTAKQHRTEMYQAGERVACAQATAQSAQAAAEQEVASAQAAAQQQVAAAQAAAEQEVASVQAAAQQQVAAAQAAAQAQAVQAERHRTHLFSLAQQMFEAQANFDATQAGASAI